MRGNMLVVRPNGTMTHSTYDTPLPDGTIGEVVGGIVELVPYFTRYDRYPVNGACLAFVNEEGKIKGLEFNIRAQMMWEAAVGRRITEDVLVGNLAIVWGDRGWMEQL